MLEKLQKVNPDLNLKSVHDKSFKSYGNIIEENVEELVSYASNYINPPNIGNIYVASDAKIEAFKIIKDISQKIYGYMEIEAGTVCGYNDQLNGIEYHQGSETIIAVTDFVLIVGHRWDMKGNTYDLSLCEAFYVPSGTIVECYSTTLHYTPCRVNDDAFKTICILPRGTGDQLRDGPQGILKRKNKWFICHPDNLEKVKSGDYPGCLGEIIKINHEIVNKGTKR